jgi:hypothetical protein
MKYNSYKTISSHNLDFLNIEVNDFISKGCLPLGGVSSVNDGKNILFLQTLTVNDESNDALGEKTIEEEYIIEVKKLALSGNKLVAVKLLKEKTGMDLREAKEWVDRNC